MMMLCGFNSFTGKDGRVWTKLYVTSDSENEHGVENLCGIFCGEIFTSAECVKFPLSKEVLNEFINIEYNVSLQGSRRISAINLIKGGKKP